MNLNADLKTIGASPCLAAAMARAEADARSTTKGKLSKSMMKQRVQENAEPLLLQLMDLRNVSRSAYAQLEALTTGMDVDDIVETTATARGRGSRGRGGRGGGRGRGRGGRQMVTVSEEELDADDGANARGGTRGTAYAVFRMTLSDGQQCVEATMMAPSLVAGLDERTPIGAKVGFEVKACSTLVDVFTCVLLPRVSCSFE